MKHNSSVGDYVERFDIVMHQLMAYESAATPIYFITKFMEGLKDDIRSMVMMLGPQDLDTACSLALLHEEALREAKPVNFTNMSNGSYVKTPAKNTANFTPSGTSARTSPVHSPEDKRASDTTRTRDDRFSALKAYRSSKGLCFTCGEKWGRDHKCAA